MFQYIEEYSGLYSLLLVYFTPFTLFPRMQTGIISKNSFEFTFNFTNRPQGAYCRNFLRYCDYPSIIKQGKRIPSTFPRITICLNSLHSKKKIAQHFPELMKALPFYYGWSSYL